MRDPEVQHARQKAERIFMATIKDVARTAHVAISTVSHVINGTKYVSEDVRQRVVSAIEELHYSTNYAARSMKSKRSMQLGFVALDMCGLFFPYVLKEAAKIASFRGYSVTISDSNCDFETEKKNISDLIMRQVDGIVFSSIVKIESMKEYANYLHDQIQKSGKDIRLVSLERDFSPYGIDSICVDTYHGACQAMQHLIDAGCRSIAHISAPVGTGDDRYNAYLDTLKKYRLPMNNRLILSGDLSHNSGYEKTLELLSHQLPFDGIFVANDQMAIGVMQALLEHHFRIPEDVKVLGFDDVFVCQMLNPPLSSVHVEKRRLGRSAMELLIDAIEQEPGDGNVRNVHCETLSCCLVPRKSTDSDYNSSLDRT